MCMKGHRCVKDKEMPACNWGASVNVYRFVACTRAGAPSFTVWDFAINLAF